jgi:6-phosphogluconolactonase
MHPSKSIIVAADAADAMQRAADVLLETVQSASRRAAAVSIALSGGSTPRGMHRLLAHPPRAAGMPWKQIHVFFADERLVAYDHPASNFGAVRSDLLAGLSEPPAAVNPVPVAGRPEDSARRYEQTLREHFNRLGQGGPSFDLICLGVGPDGHTASLFPGSAAVGEQTRWAVAVRGGEPELWRVSLTLPVLNRARRVLFLVTGEEKAPVVRHLLEGLQPELPAQRVRPDSGEVLWVLDKAAAGRLEAAARLNP